MTDDDHIVAIDDDGLTEAKFLNRGRHFRYSRLIPARIARVGDQRISAGLFDLQGAFPLLLANEIGSAVPITRDALRPRVTRDGLR